MKRGKKKVRPSWVPGPGEVYAVRTVAALPGGGMTRADHVATVVSVEEGRSWFDPDVFDGWNVTVLVGGGTTTWKNVRREDVLGPGADWRRLI